MKILTIITALGITFNVSACLLEWELEAERELARTGKRDVASHFTSDPLTARQVATDIPIGTGDRFAGGFVTPVGLGVEERDLESVLNVDEVQSALQGLRRRFPDQVTLFQPPFETYEGRKLYGAVVGDNPRVFIMSGIHARERGGPDNVIYFLADLLAASKAGTGVSYGGKSYTADQVKVALSVGIVIIPLTNPDGVTHDQKNNDCWRKNRNPTSASGASNGADVGIDLNRNYDFAWNVTETFHPNIVKSGIPPASTDPRSQLFHGTAPASEPETEAVVWTFDQYTNLTWFVDLHSFGPSVLYLWGDDDASSCVSPEMNFNNPKYDGLRGLVGEDPSEAKYREYFSKSDWVVEKDVTDKMVSSMLAVGGAKYTNYAAVGLYPTSGCSNDYAMGRYYGNMSCGASRMFGLTIEFGAPSKAFPTCPFYPSLEEYHRNVRQVGAGFLEMMLQAAGTAGDPLYLEC